MFWHTDTYNLTLEEPQLKALHGKKLMINVRAGELQICHSEGAPAWSSSPHTSSRVLCGSVSATWTACMLSE